MSATISHEFQEHQVILSIPIHGLLIDARASDQIGWHDHPRSCERHQPFLSAEKLSTSLTSRLLTAAWVWRKAYAGSSPT